MIIQNPCKGICKVHPIYKVCQGCYRTRLEVATWNTMKEETKLNVVEALIGREKIYGELNV